MDNQLLPYEIALQADKECFQSKTTIKKYTFRLHHDKGTVKLTTTATTLTDAINIICDNEMCPEQALQLVQITK